VDGVGNVLVTGRFRGTVDFGGGPRTSSGGFDIFVAKFSGVDGSHLWSKRFGSTGSDHGDGVAADSSGNVLLTGFFYGTVDFGGGPRTSTGSSDIFVVKLSGGDGSHVWSTAFGSINHDQARGIAVDGSGNVLVTGFQSTGGTGAEDIFVGKLSGTNGAHLWSSTFGSINSDEARDIAVDGSGNVLVTGLFCRFSTTTCTVDFGGGGLTSAGSDDIFVAKFSGPDGSHVWSKRFGSTGSDQGSEVAVDSGGNVAVTGLFDGTVDFGGGGLTSAGSGDIFVADFSGVDGSHLWSRGFGSVGTDQGIGAAVDSSGNVLVTGRFQGTVDFGGTLLTSAGSFDIFVIKRRR
jgi:hypothetical protein